MKKLVTVLPVLAFLVAGCGGSSEIDKIATEVNETNEQMAAAIEKANDLATLDKTTQPANERMLAIRKRLGEMTADRRRVIEASVMPRVAESQSRVVNAQAAFVKRIKAGPNPQVIIDTSAGPIRAELYEKAAPVTVKNFLEYVDAKFFDGTIFHRVIPDFMIQGGGFEPGMKEKETRKPIVNEAYNGLTNERGTLAMARTNDPHSATAQFFINVQDNKALDQAQARDHVGYAVFGKVVDGMEVVDRIQAVPTHTFDHHENVPVQDVVIKSIRRAPN